MSLRFINEAFGKRRRSPGGFGPTNFMWITWAYALTLRCSLWMRTGKSGGPQRGVTPSQACGVFV